MNILREKYQNHKITKDFYQFYMRDNTTQLKSNWKSDDLILIANLNKSNDQSHCYFNSFINPVSKEKLFYPRLEVLDVEVRNKTIVVFNGSAPEFSCFDSQEEESEFVGKWVVKLHNDGF